MEADLPKCHQSIKPMKVDAAIRPRIGPRVSICRSISQGAIAKCSRLSHLGGRLHDATLAFRDSLAPVPHIWIVVDQLPTAFHESDGRGAGEGYAALLQNGFEHVEEISWRHGWASLVWCQGGASMEV